MPCQGPFLFLFSMTMEYICDIHYFHWYLQYLTLVKVHLFLIFLQIYICLQYEDPKTDASLDFKKFVIKYIISR